MGAISVDNSFRTLQGFCSCRDDLLGSMTSSNLQTLSPVIIIPRFNEVERHAYWFHLVCPSGRPSVRLWKESCLPRIFHNIHLIQLMVTYLTNQFQKMCRVLSFYSSKIRIFGDFLYFGLLDPDRTFAYHPWWPWPTTTHMTLNFHQVVLIVTLFSNIIHENTYNTIVNNNAYQGYCKHVLWWRPLEKALAYLAGGSKTGGTPN